MGRTLVKSSPHPVSYLLATWGAPRSSQVITVRPAAAARHFLKLGVHLQEGIKGHNLRDQGAPQSRERTPPRLPEAQMPLPVNSPAGRSQTAL